MLLYGKNVAQIFDYCSALCVCVCTVRTYMCVQVPYDLVVSAYSLSEIPTIALRKSVVRSLWEKTNDFLVRRPWLIPCVCTKHIQFYYGNHNEVTIV